MTTLSIDSYTLVCVNKLKFQLQVVFVSEFVKLMKEKHIREGSISKYCFAASCLYKELKNNNFRPQLKIFNKLICGNLTSA